MSVQDNKILFGINTFSLSEELKSCGNYLKIVTSIANFSILTVLTTIMDCPFTIYLNEIKDCLFEVLRWLEDILGHISAFGPSNRLS